MKLAITLSSASKEFVSTELILFDCGARSTCLDCVGSGRWSCMWCIFANRNNIQSHKDNPSQVISRGADYCPRVQVSKDLFIPNGVPQELSLTVSNIPDLGGAGTSNDGFLCEVEIEDAKFRVPAKLDGDTVTCERTSSYKYQANLPMINATISVLWDASHLVDRTNISLYKCGLVGSYKGHSDCSLCISRTQDLGCVWCGSGCEFTTACPTGQSDVCPQPRIDLVQPLSGPVDGGTEITIEGSNLATTLQQVQGNIYLDNIPCAVIDYQVSVRISCRTGKSGRETDLAVRLRTEHGIIQSAVKFRYREVILASVTPTIGPRSGGTLITVEGVNLNIGSSISILLDNIPCKVDKTRLSSTRVSCRTGAAPGPMAVRSLVLIIDDARRTLSNPYNYTADPSIEAVRPLWSFLSGGRILTVRGRNLHTVHTPYITALDKRGVGVGRSACTVVTSTLMECPSPPIVPSAARLSPDPVSQQQDPGSQQQSLHQLSPTTNKDRDQEQTFRIGFEMDSVESGLPGSPGNSGSSVPPGPAGYSTSTRTGHPAELIYVEDPVYYKFQDNEKSYKGDALVIEGYNLNRAADETDLDVRIGSGVCNVTSLTATQLLCLPPQQAPPPLLHSSSHPEVVVYVGRNLKFEIGQLRYNVNSSELFLPPQVIGGIAAATALALTVMIAFLVAMRHKRTQAEREYKRIQIQMDTLENNVRSECKQAFAELQTDMSDLTMDLEVSGIPLLDHRTYVIKVFFPGQGDHRLLLDPRLSGMARTARNDLDTAMLQFEQLINNKWFLLTFIETLERQKSFSVEDRMNTASLIMIILMTKMEYCTDILRCLLLRQIEKSLSTKNPGSMLARTETVLEKLLSNWLTLCLYDYMKDYAGSSLFVLFKAIKFQIEKGPVDAVTHDARYSLSEEKLLREQVVANLVVCRVVQEELEEEVTVRVLDCDTISQVKSKILDAVYKNTPFSLRPRVDEVDLEWRCGQYAQPGTPAGTLVLQDIDITSKSEQNTCVTRLNTLAHYGLKEKAVVSLVPKQLDSPSQHIYQEINSSTILYGAVSLSQYGHHGHIYQQPAASGWQPAAGAASTTAYSTLYSTGTSSLAAAMDQQQQQFCHFVRPDNNPSQLKFSHKQIPEIFLTRLLSTKGTVQKFVDDFFGTILKVPGSKFPAPVKWLFDLLDDVAHQHNLHNTEVLHSWKSNSLPLRIWVNFIKNPDFIFDVNKTATTNSCLSVIAQTFMDSCSLDDNILGKDSPSSKLLFAKDIPLYRQLVVDYYAEVARLPQVTDQELSFHLQQLSSAHTHQFDNMVALKELYVYVSKYYGDLMVSLNENINCVNQRLGARLENVAMTLYASSQQHYAQHT